MLWIIIIVFLCSIVPAAVTNFSVVQEYPNPNDTNVTVVNVTIYWNKVRFIIMELHILFLHQPPASSRPSLEGYVIYQNITGAQPQIQLDSPSASSYIIPNAATIGSVYAVTVGAINVLGTGSSLSTTIS